MVHSQPSSAGSSDLERGPAVSGSPFANGWQFSSGARVGRWAIDAPIGRGGMGEVYRAHDAEKPDCLAAVKVLVSHKRDRDSSHRRFLQEANTLSALDHPNVVSFLEVGATDDDQPYMVTELLDGLTLAELLDHQGRFDVADSLDICAKIASGLAAAHRVGVLHRDLKPANVLVTIGEAVKILDFGIAKPFQGSALSNRLAPSTDKNVIVGTWSSLSPEQILGRAKLGPSTDVFSLGALAYELMAGRSPWADDDDELPAMDVLGMRILTSEPRPLPALFNGFPSEVWEVIKRALHKQPAKRFTSMEALANALDNAREHFVAGKRQGMYNLPTLRGRVALMRRGTHRVPVEADVTSDAPSELETVTDSQVWRPSSDFQTITPLTSTVTTQPPTAHGEHERAAASSTETVRTAGVDTDGGAVGRKWVRLVAAMAATFALVAAIGIVALQASSPLSPGPASKTSEPEARTASAPNVATTNAALSNPAPGPSEVPSAERSSVVMPAAVASSSAPSASVVRSPQSKASPPAVSEPKVPPAATTSASPPRTIF